MSWWVSDCMVSDCSRMRGSGLLIDEGVVHGLAAGDVVDATAELDGLGDMDSRRCLCLRRQRRMVAGWEEAWEPAGSGHDLDRQSSRPAAMIPSRKYCAPMVRIPYHASRYRKNTGLKLDPWICVWHMVQA